MKKKYEIAAIENIKITLDLSFFDKEEEIYFNATEIAHSFGKNINEWSRSKETLEYLDAILEEYPSLNMGNSTYLDYGKLIKTARGRYGGTYLHNILAIPFARWCRPQLAVKLDKYLVEKIKNEHQRKIFRLEAKTGFLPMTNAIQDAHEQPRGYHYSNESNMLNKIITGKSTKQIREENNTLDVRGTFTSKEIEALDFLQRTNTTLIDLEMPYEERKIRLAKLYKKKFLSNEIDSKIVLFQQ